MKNLTAALVFALSIALLKSCLGEQPEPPRTIMACIEVEYHLHEESVLGVLTGEKMLRPVCKETMEVRNPAHEVWAKRNTSQN